MTDHSEDNNGTAQLLRSLFRQKWRIIFLTVLLSGLAVFLVKKQTPRYASVSTILCQSSSNTAFNSMSAMAAFAGIDLGNQGNNITDYLSEIVYSTDVLSAIAQKEWRAKLISRDSTHPQTLDKWWKIPVDTTVLDWKMRLQEDIIGKLKSKRNPYITYETDPKNGLITLTTNFEDPLVSYEVNLFLINKLNEYVLHKMKGKASQSMLFIEERLIESKENLRQAELDLLHFRQNNPMIVDPAIRLSEDRLVRELAAQMELHIQFRKQYEMARIDQLREQPVLEILDGPTKLRSPTSPKYMALSVVGIIGSFLFSFLLFYFYDIIRQNRKKISSLLKNS